MIGPPGSSVVDPLKLLNFVNAQYLQLWPNPIQHFRGRLKHPARVYYYLGEVHEGGVNKTPLKSQSTIFRTEGIKSSKIAYSLQAGLVFVYMISTHMNSQTCMVRGSDSGVIKYPDLFMS